VGIEPPPSPWELPPASSADDRGVVGVGADLEPGTLLAAYRSGLFPMPVDGGVLAWWSPDPRGIIPLDGLRVSRSLRQAVRRFEVTVDQDFPAVIAACADPTRPHGWINGDIVRAYTRLHELGWAHSVECWGGGDLVGGLYGVAVGGLFAGESMFHHRPDASKVALVHLVELLGHGDGRLLDVQWTTPHLVSLGAVDIDRDEYLTRLGTALDAPLPEAFRA
jgi:leucyl/phenylalanyl-tRNA---protein transferase